MKIRLLSVLTFFALFSSCVSTPVVNDGSSRIADVDPVEVGKVGVGTKSLFSGVTQSDATIIFKPRTNAVVVQTKIDGLKVKLQLTEAARTSFIEAVDKYRKDFDARTLNVQARRTGSVYGSAGGKVEWGMFTYNGKAEPKVQYGYTFIERKTPYFTLTMAEAPNLGENRDENSLDDKSPRMVLYFTRKQATELAEMLLQDNLEGILKDKSIEERMVRPDVYGE